jgi:thermitase
MKHAARYAIAFAILAVLAFALPAVPSTASELPASWALSSANVTGAWAAAGDAGGATAGAGVVVGVVDSGVALSAPELAGATEVAGTDVVDGDADATDDDGHGTAVASEIVGRTVGVARGARLVVAKVLDARGAGTTAQLAAGIDYVGAQGARVAVVSVGGARSAAVEQAIAAHPGTLYVVAAGNAGGDVDGGAAAPAASWPCAEDAANVLCVSASGRDDALAAISNRGAVSVDLAAPGVSVPAATLTGTGTWTGTSFAAPLVAGTAAVLFGADPSATVAQVKAAIVGSADPVAALAGTSVSGGRLDAAAALTALTGATAPAPVQATATATAPAPTANATPAAGATAAATAVTVSVSARTSARSVRTVKRAVARVTAKHRSKVKKARTGKHEARKSSRHASAR